MFRTAPLSINSSFSLYTQQWCMSYSLRAGSGRNCSSVLILLASCMTYNIAVCTVKISWWWTEELSETCRVLFQKQIWEISASSWFCCKGIQNHTKLFLMEKGCPRSGFSTLLLQLAYVACRNAVIFGQRSRGWMVAIFQKFLWRKRLTTNSEPILVA